MRVIISVDATPFFRASATRADVWVDCWGDVSPISVLCYIYLATLALFFYHTPHWCVMFAGDPKTWMSWFILDGIDKANALTGIDRAGSLNDQIIHLQDNVSQVWLAKKCPSCRYNNVLPAYTVPSPQGPVRLQCHLTGILASYHHKCNLNQPLNTIHDAEAWEWFKRHDGHAFPSGTSLLAMWRQPVQDDAEPGHQRCPSIWGVSS